MIKRECDARTRERTVRRHMAWCGGLALTMPFAISAQQTDLVGPSGSGRFGASVAFLQNGNFVVADPEFDDDRTTA